MNLEDACRSPKHKKYVIYNYVSIIPYPETLGAAESRPLFYRWGAEGRMRVATCPAPQLPRAELEQRLCYTLTPPLTRRLRDGTNKAGKGMKRAT